MKSSIENLRQRGYIEDLELGEYLLKDREALVKLLTHQEAYVRSAAAKTLSIKCDMNDVELTRMILQQLVKEKKLYTRLEMCAALEKGGNVTAQEMIDYIGKIGNNQHHILPEKPSKKKSYPLARDLIVRSLARMHMSIMPLMMQVLRSGDEGKIAEILDGIGAMAFYHQEAAKIEYVDVIIETMNTYNNNDVIYWKAILCLSGFPYSKTEAFLRLVILENRKTLFVEEAKRSLSLLKK